MRMRMKMSAGNGTYCPATPLADRSEPRATASRSVLRSGTHVAHEGAGSEVLGSLFLSRPKRDKFLTMFRILASAVIVLQLQALAAPALMAHPGHADTHACEESVAVHAGMSHLASEFDCQDCDMPGCEAMPGCSGLTAFAAPAAESDMMQSLAHAGQSDPATHPDKAEGPPISPPPRD